MSPGVGSRTLLPAPGGDAGPIWSALRCIKRLAVAAHLAQARGISGLPPCLYHAMAFRVFAYGDDPAVFERLCVDCGRYTHSFCERECPAALRIPSEYWEPGQRTPHCTACERRYIFCHYCRGVEWCTPPGWRPSR